MEKKFDCIKMKNDIQEKLYTQRSGTAKEKQLKEIHEKLEKGDSPAAKLWQRLNKVSAFL